MRKTTTLTNAMAAAGYHLDEEVSTDEYQLFHHDDHISHIQFYGWHEVDAWLRGVVFDDPAVDDAVTAIFNSEF